MDTKQKHEKTNLTLKLLMGILFIIGAMIFSYPFIANAVNTYYDQKMMEKNLAEMATENAEQEAKLFEEMTVKNKELANSENRSNIPGMGLVEDPFERSVNNVQDPGTEYYEAHHVGAVYIPAINVSLPLFDETNSMLLEKGAAILQGTSFPIGGENTHSVISAHSGLSNRKLFTDLEELEIGDVFYLTIAGEKLAYEVDELQIVLLNEIDKLVIQPGRDLVTLLTCVPYGINTHRLLVTGHRIPYEEEMKQEIQRTQDKVNRRFYLYIVLIILFFDLMFYWMYRQYVSYQSGKRTYTLSFQVIEKGQAKSGVTFVLTEKRREEVNPNQQLTTVSDINGQVSFENVRGGRYWVKAVDPLIPSVKASIRRLKDEQFSLKGKKSVLKREKIENKVKYTLEIEETKK